MSRLPSAEPSSPAKPVPADPQPAELVPVDASPTEPSSVVPSTAVTLFLCGDVMVGRGIDQILQHPSDPTLHEPHVDNAQQYVRLAEQANGRIPRRAHDDYIWGEALPELKRVAPDWRIINLETAITTSDDFEPRKEVHYRMHPSNVGCLLAPAIDSVVASSARPRAMRWVSPARSAQIR